MGAPVLPIRFAPDLPIDLAPDLPSLFTGLFTGTADGSAEQDAQQLGAARALDEQAIAGQPLTRRDAPDVERKIRDARETARLGVEMRELEHPAMPLTAGVLARDPVEPALDAARQPEVGRIDASAPASGRSRCCRTSRAATNSMPSTRPAHVDISSHSLIQENCRRRQCSPLRMVVAITVDCSRASAAFRQDDHC